LNFSPHLAVLAEYQFLDDKLPGVDAERASGICAYLVSNAGPGGRSLSQLNILCTWRRRFYRKVTSFTDRSWAVLQLLYCGVVSQNVVVGISQATRRLERRRGLPAQMGGMYGESRMKLFGEVRYLM